MTAPRRRTGPAHSAVRPDDLLIGLALAVAVLLVTAAALVPGLLGWWVNITDASPLHASWDPRLGPGTAPTLLLAAAVVWFGPPLARTLPWRTLLMVVFALAATWAFALALVDPAAGFGSVLDRSDEYLPTARALAEPEALAAALRDWVARLPQTAPGSWPTHIAGHPPGALLVFIALQLVGLGAPPVAGAVVVLVGATTPLAVLITLRRLLAEPFARAAAPFLTAGPSALWIAVSADAVFAATAAWGLALLAVAATEPDAAPPARGHRSPPRGISRAVLAAAAGLVLGWSVFLSYGLLALGLVAVAILAVARSWWPLPWAIGGALTVVAAFALAGFRWWEGSAGLTSRYWEGLAQDRPGEYWTWANLAVLVLAAGPALAAGLALVGARLTWHQTAVARALRRPGAPPRSDGAVSSKPVLALTAAAVVIVLVVTCSQLTRAETERIWLPFMPWLLLSTALLPVRWQRPLLGVQVTVAVTLQHLLDTVW